MNIKDIEVGMYIRANGDIGKVTTDSIHFYDPCFCKVIVKINKILTAIDEEDLKASHNIMDIIETGDYVNSCKVTEIGYGFVIVNSENYRVYDKSAIKSIVTKEYFEKGKFEV